MGSWKKQKSAINPCAANDPKYAVTVLRLLVKIMQQPTFYEVCQPLSLSLYYSVSLFFFIL